MTVAPLAERTGGHAKFTRFGDRPFCNGQTNQARCWPLYLNVLQLTAAIAISQPVSLSTRSRMVTPSVSTSISAPA